MGVLSSSRSVIRGPSSTPTNGNRTAFSQGESPSSPSLARAAVLNSGAWMPWGGDGSPVVIKAAYTRGACFGVCFLFMTLFQAGCLKKSKQMDFSLVHGLVCWEFGFQGKLCVIWRT